MLFFIIQQYIYPEQSQDNYVIIEDNGTGESVSSSKPAWVLAVLHGRHVKMIRIVLEYESPNKIKINEIKGGYYNTNNNSYPLTNHFYACSTCTQPKLDFLTFLSTPGIFL